MVLVDAIAALTDPLLCFVIMDEAVWIGPGHEFLLPPNPTMEERGARIKVGGFGGAIRDSIRPTAAIGRGLAKADCRAGQ